MRNQTIVRAKIDAFRSFFHAKMQKIARFRSLLASSIQPKVEFPPNSKLRALF